jgi:mannose-6-phosphate isomerase-like protein (cupin superfamily)
MNTELVKDHLRKVILIRKEMAEINPQTIIGNEILHYKKYLLNAILHFDTQKNEDLAWSQFSFSTKINSTIVGVSNTFMTEWQKMLTYTDQYIENIQHELQDQRFTDEEIALLTPTPIPKSTLTPKKTIQIVQPKRNIIPNYTTYNVGSFDNLLPDNQLIHSSENKLIDNLFVGEKIGSKSVEISFHVIPPQSGSTSLHGHRQNEEIYLFLKGTGHFQVDNEVFSVTEGTIVRVSPNGERAWKNSSDSTMVFMAIQVRKGLLNYFTHQDKTIGHGKLLFEK